MVCPMKHSIDVTLEYKLIGQADWAAHPFQGEQYFDPDYLDPGEDPAIDDVPMYDRAIDYLSVPGSLVEKTRLKIRDLLRNEGRTIAETFWNGGRNVIVERTDYKSDEPSYWEVIIECQIADKPLTLEIIRIGRDEGVPCIYLHTYVTDQDDGSQTEQRVFPRPSEGQNPG